MQSFVGKYKYLSEMTENMKLLSKQGVFARRFKVKHLYLTTTFNMKH
jgi:hypothetical protein